MAKGQKDKRTNNDPQNTTQKPKDQATRTPPGVPEGLAVLFIIQQKICTLYI
jgi:hypothetical protein